MTHTHTEDLYAVIDLGSGTIRGMVGKKKEGKVYPIARAEEPTGNSIRKGVVYNVDDLYHKLESIINELNAQLPFPSTRIQRIYVGFGGMSLISRSFSIQHRMEQEDGEEISDYHMQLIEERLNDYRYNAQEVLSVSQPYSLVDGRMEKTLKGLVCREFSVHFNLIMTRSSHVNFIRLATERLGIELVEVLPSPCSEADVLLYPDAKSLGVAIVNIGAGTTSVAIYKNDSLKVLRVIPFGSKNITNDLMTLRITYPEAEKIKLEKASPFTDQFDNEIIKLPTPDGISMRDIKMRDVNSLVTARLKEISANVMRVINEFQAGSRLASGIVFTGQGALMRNFLHFFQEQYNRDCNFVYLARDINEKVCREDNPLATDVDYASCMGLIYNAQVNCVESIYQSASKVEPTDAIHTHTVESTVPSATLKNREEELTKSPSFSTPEDGAHNQRLESQNLFDIPYSPTPTTQASRKEKAKKRKKNWISKAKESLSNLLNNDDEDIYEE